MNMFIKQNLNNPSFKAGVTTLYTDFDGTYMPFSHEYVCKNCSLFSLVINRKKES